MTEEQQPRYKGGYGGIVSGKPAPEIFIVSKDFMQAFLEHTDPWTRELARAKKQLSKLVKQ